MKPKLASTGFIALLIILLFTACKKNDSNQAAVETRVKLYIEDVSATIYHTIDSFNITYEADDRITSMNSTHSGLQFLFSYNGNTGYQTDIINSSHLTIREFSYLNAEQLVDSTFQYNDTYDSTTTRLIYNANRQIIREIFYDYSLPSGSVLWKAYNYTYDVNGNRLKNYQTNAAGDTSIISTYEYNNIVPNWYNMAPKYRQRPYNNMPVLQTDLHTLSNSTVTLTTTYTLDNDNRIATETQSDSYGNTVIKKYNYY